MAIATAIIGQQPATGTAFSLTPAALLRVVQAARPNWRSGQCRVAAAAIVTAGLQPREAFGSLLAWLEYLERELSHYEERNPQRPRAACACEAQACEWRARWEKHRQLQRACCQGRSS